MASRRAKVSAGPTFRMAKWSANQRAISLASLVVGGVRFVDHRGTFDPGGKRFRFLRLVMNDLRMVELHPRLHDDSDNSLQRSLESQLTESSLMGFECRRGILRPAREWSEADLISSSFGQSLSVTVLQMAQAYLTLANEGVYKPLRIVLTDDVGGGDQRIFSKNTTREVLSMMREVVDEARASVPPSPGVSVAGKTGTAQKAFRGKYGGERTASFVGLVPAEKPQYLVVIFIDEPSK